MKNIEEALRVLGLTPRASMDEVHEAYRDLMLVWDPERLSDEENLQEKARVKRESIQEAFACIQSKGLPKRPEESGVEPGGEGRSAESPAGQRRSGTGPSLYDDIFSKRGARPSLSKPVMLIGGAAVLALILLLFALPSGSEEKEVTPPVAGTLSSSPAQVPPPVEQVPAEEVKPESAPESVPPEPEPRERSLPGPTEASPGDVRTDERAAGEESAESGQPTPSPPKERVSERQAMQQPPTKDEAISLPEAAEEESPEEAVEDLPQEPDEEELSAFETLKEVSRAAALLVSNQSEGVAYREWSVVQKRGKEIWIDVIGVELERGEEVHCIWSVNTEDRSARALSQAARDIEAQARTAVPQRASGRRDREGRIG